MTLEENYKITSNDYFDFIIKYNGNPKALKQYEQYSVQIMNDIFAVIYIPISEITPNLIAQYNYSSIPYCYSLASNQSLEASGVNKLRKISSFNLRGKGVLVGIIDTGIDYTNPVFQYLDGTTKIVSIWDQNIESVNKTPATTLFPPLYGMEYTSEEINQALKSQNPFAIVASTDTIGHGTMLAGIAAGSEDTANDFSGVVPDAEFIIVKLKQAKSNLMEYNFIPQNVPCYQENDLCWANQYIADKARQLKRPVAVCFGIGTSQGAHNNTGYFNTSLSTISNFPGVAISVAAGNEGNAKRHFFSTIDSKAGLVPFELNVGDNEYGFAMELWGDPPMIYSLDIESPYGQYISSVSESLKESREIRFLFENTVIYVNNIIIEQDTGKQVISLRFKNPTSGVWRFKVYGRGDLPGLFHIWLPSGNFISENTYFINSTPHTTITSPGNSVVPITITAYNSKADSLYPNSGKGFSASNIINPDLAAPGVEIQCPTLNHNFTTITGTGAATAHATGIAAMILEWSIVQNNYPGIDTVGVKNFLIRGARRFSSLQYPNQEWGYGIIDIYNSFNIMRTDIMNR